MADRWVITEKGPGDWSVERNGSWFTDVDDEQDGLGIVRGYRPDKVTIVEADGHRRTVKMR